MEGWDAEGDGSPSELTLRRWEHFGLSGAKLIWGGEAAAVQPDGRANPHQTLATPDNRDGLARLLQRLRTAHRTHCGSTDDLLVGLQLTHSGRFSRPNSQQPEPRIAYHHPLLDTRLGIAADNDQVVWTDSDVERLIDSYVAAAGTARDVGFQFVDIKSCHGYLLHEFLSARRRPGPFGGDYEGRTRLLKTIIRRVQSTWSDLSIGVRLSVYDTLPYQLVGTAGEPMPTRDALPYECGFGVCPEDPLRMDLTEPIQLLTELRDMGVAAVNVTCGSPYYNPHIQRPAIFPPSDGYPPPEDPLVGVHRLIDAARRCKEAVTGLTLVGTGYTYLQDYLAHVAQAVVRAGWIDLVGVGRMALSYPEFPRDCLELGHLQRKKVCRTFSDCTTAPRQGLVSGCYPLDSYYKSLPQAELLRQLKGKTG
jgi:2,4-dienoyl-CoA reductase-like NADH-dependent reductase (Old Yellow Enzyme family)